jgi:amidase
MTVLDLCYLSACEVLARFRARELSPVEYLEALETRAAEVEPTVNAFSDRYFEDARAAARQAEARYAARQGGLGPLEGLVFAVKDDTAIAGRHSSMGSLIHRDRIDAETNPSVERLVHAGGIVHARTSCPEFCWPWLCYSRIHGVTRNPWSPKHTPGGSSGGSAAALAAGTTPLATGTDSGGSIRMPAAMCGVVGFKPPYGRNPESPSVNLDPYWHIGPMARSVADCALMQNLMSGLHPADHATLRQPVRIPERLEKIEGLRIAYSVDLGFHQVSTDVCANTLDALVALRGAGAVVEEVEIDWAEGATRAAGHWGDYLNQDLFADAVENHPEKLCDYTLYFAEGCARVTHGDFRESMRLAARTWRDHVGPLFERYDALICPTVAVSEIAADLPSWEDFEIEGVPVHQDGSWVMTILFNMWSRCPVLAVPSGFARCGVPTGIQIVGRPFDDICVFRVGAALERERAWLDWQRRRPQPF